VAKAYYSQHIKFALSMISIAVLLSGCATTSSSSSSEWNAKNIGQGMQVGAMGSSGNPLSGIIWGLGFLVEQIGGAVESSPPPPRYDEEMAN
jgi:hypothetical protein